MLESDMSPQQYFDAVKSRKQNMTDEKLCAVYDNCLTLLNKYYITGQRVGMEKLLFHLDCIEKEREIVSMGIDTFVYRDDIEFYIEEVAESVVKIIDIESYEREIPDDVVNIVSRVKDKFDQLYIVFTDYTGNAERKVEEERRRKDPILFGTFQDEKSRSINDRFYYLADWVDEYCDLTLDKMVNEVRKNSGKNIEHKISTPEDLEELKSQLSFITKQDDVYVFSDNKVEKSFFGKIKTFLTGRS